MRIKGQDNGCELDRIWAANKKSASTNKIKAINCNCGSGGRELEEELEQVEES